MYYFDDAYQLATRKAKERFLNGEDISDSPVRAEIIRSWKRSLAFGVSTEKVARAVRVKREVKMLIEESRTLIEICRPYMKRLYSTVEGSGFYLMLCNRSGIILDLTGDAEIIQKARRMSNLVVGADRSERYAGTNAIGTCLAIGEPIQIWGDEHYVRKHTKYTCSGGPIQNGSGEIIGCLNITGLSTKTHTHSLGMILSAVDGISKEFSMRESYEKIKQIHARNSAILESVQSGFVLLDKEGVIIQANKKALHFLKEDREIVGQYFFRLYSPGNYGAEILLPGARPVLNEEIDFSRRNSGPPFRIIFSVLKTGEHSKWTTILKLDDPKSIHRIAMTFSGFSAHFTFHDMIGASKGMQEVITLARYAASGDSNVLILGESGTGKELIAHAIHNYSDRRSGPFVALNCGALPRGLIESELFGYEAGAFTGARKDVNPGKFELANGGTVFLDEIGNMPLNVQVMLLRILQTHEIARIGGRYARMLDIRIIAATNANLEELVGNKSFREDLYYRLNVIPIQLPPLRDRGEDIRLLTDHFLEKFNADRKVPLKISSNAMDHLMKYPWPGNVRELENALERAAYFAREGIIEAEKLPQNITAPATSPFSPPATEEGKPMTGSPDPIGASEQTVNIHELNLMAIHRVLSQTRGNVSKSALLLGMSRRTLYRKLDEYGIDAAAYRKTV